MSQIKIDLKKKFLEQLCTFEIAKKLKEAGVKSNTLCYDENGKMNDGGWMEGMTRAVMYPIISFTDVLGFLDDTDMEADKFNCYEQDGKYHIQYKDEEYQSENLVDVIALFWLKHKNPDMYLMG